MDLAQRELLSNLGHSLAAETLPRKAWVRALRAQKETEPGFPFGMISLSISKTCRRVILLSLLTVFVAAKFFSNSPSCSPEKGRTQYTPHG